MARGGTQRGQRRLPAGQLGETAGDVEHLGDASRVDLVDRDAELIELGKRETMLFDTDTRVEGDPRREERLLWSVAPYIKPGG